MMVGNPRSIKTNRCHGDEAKLLLLLLPVEVDDRVFGVLGNSSKTSREKKFRQKIPSGEFERERYFWIRGVLRDGLCLTVNENVTCFNSKL